MMQRWAIVSMVAGLWVLFAGCKSEDLPYKKTPVGEGAVYVNRELRKTYDKPIDVVYPAAQTALKDGLKITTIPESNFDRLRADIKGSLSDGTHFSITMETVEKGTYMEIHVGVLGDKNISANIMREIDKALGIAPSEPPKPAETKPAEAAPPTKADTATQKAADETKKAQTELEGAKLTPPAQPAPAKPPEAAPPRAPEAKPPTPAPPKPAEPEKKQEQPK